MALSARRVRLTLRPGGSSKIVQSSNYLEHRCKSYTASLLSKASLWSYPVIDISVKISRKIHLVWVREELGLPVRSNLPRINTDILNRAMAARTDQAAEDLITSFHRYRSATVIYRRGRRCFTVNPECAIEPYPFQSVTEDLVVGIIGICLC